MEIKNYSKIEVEFSNKAHLTKLDDFYSDVYVAEFPDPDERESLQNINDYLKKKIEGWYQLNNYHILLLLDSDDNVIAASICDYLEKPNAGVIEFLLVAPKYRTKGIGKMILDYTELTLEADATRTGRSLDIIVGEMNDPFKIAHKDDNIDPFDRAKIWGKWKYQKLNFLYIQPALSESQEPVHHLLLMGKINNKSYQAKGIPSEIIKLILHEYIFWAMRIENPDNCSEYRKMCRYLDTVERVSTTPFERYVGYDEKNSMVINEAKFVDSDEFILAFSVYKQSFPPSLVSAERTDFIKSLKESNKDNADFYYHLWVIRENNDNHAEGMASFFTFPKIGFGGYLTLTGNLQGKGILRLLIARIEEAMIRDGINCVGWLIECEPDTVQLDIFKKVGFHEISLNYRQPIIYTAYPIGADVPVLKLLYKNFGDNYEKPVLDNKILLNAIASIFHVVYQIKKPQNDKFFKEIQAQIKNNQGNSVPFI